MYKIALCVMAFLIPGSVCLAEWGSWTPLNPCNSMCWRTVKRQCVADWPGGEDCLKANGDMSQTDMKVIKDCVHGQGTCKAEWTSWNMGTCSVTCGDGTQTRTRLCKAIGIVSDVPQSACGSENAIETVNCNPRACPVNGGWGTWAPWSACVDGSRRRRRVCDRPAAANGGADCAGESEEPGRCAVPTQASSAPGLAVHGGWSDWNVWGDCSEGAKQRNRTCDNPPPSNGGVICPGDAKKDKNCACVSSPCLYGSTCYARGRRDFYCSCVEKRVVRTKRCEPDLQYEKVEKYVGAGLITVIVFIGLAYLALCIFECWEFWPREEEDPVDWDYIKAYFRQLILGDDDPARMAANTDDNPAPEGQHMERQD